MSEIIKNIVGPKDGDGKEKKEASPASSAEIFFLTAAANAEARRAQNQAQFTEMVGAKPQKGDYDAFRDSLYKLAERIFGKPIDQIEIKMTEEQRADLFRITREIQQSLRDKGIDPAVFYGENGILE